MAINSNVPDRLAREALATGGMRRPLQGQDVLETDPRQLDLELLPEAELDAIEQVTPTDTEEIEVAVLGHAGPLANRVLQTTKETVGRALSPKEDVFNKSQEVLRRLEAEEVVPPQQAPPVVEPDAAPATGDDLDAEMESMGFNQAYDDDQAQGYEAFQQGSIVDRDTADKVRRILDEPAQVDSKGMLDDFRAVGAAGDAKIPDEANVLSSIQAISKTYAGKITEEKRGTITLEATRQLADLVGVAPERLQATILGRQRGGVIIDQEGGLGLAESMVAARDLLVREMKKLDQLAKKAEFGTDEDALNFRAQLELVAQLQAQIKGAQTEIARALSSFRIPARDAGQAEEMRAADVQNLLEQFGGADDAKDMAKAYNQAGSNPAAKAAVARGFSKTKRFSDAAYEVWINVLLSSPVTHTKNIVGAFLTTFAHLPETYAAATVGAVRQRLGGRQAAVSMGEANAALFGTVMSMREAFGAAGKTFKTGDQAIAGSKLEGHQGRRNPRAFSAQGLQAQGFGTAIDMLGKFMTLGRLPTRALEFEDTFFKVVAQRQLLYQNAYSTGVAKGKRGDELATHIAEFVFDPPASALEKADAHAQYVTLQTNLDSVGKSIKTIRDKTPSLRYFLPFLKTPYNAFKYSFIDRGPIGLFYGESKAAIDKAKLPGATMADRAAGDAAIARLSMGNATLFTMAGLVAAGQVTGKGPNDKGIRDNLRQTGWQPYSIKIGDRYVSYVGMEPFSSVMMLGADTAEVLMSGRVDQDSGEELIAAVAAAFAYQLTEKTFMSGFSSLVNTLNDPTRYAGNTIESLIGSFVPRIVAQIERNVDPTVRAAEGVLERMKSQIPGWSSTLPPRRNLAGQAIVLDGAYGPDIFSPLYSTTTGPNKFDPDKRRAQRAFDMFQELIDVRFKSTPHPDTFNSDISLSPEATDVYHQYAGKRTLDYLERLFDQDEYQRIKAKALDGDLTAREILHTSIRKQVAEARRDAKGDLLKDPDYGQKLIDLLERVDQDKKEKLRKAIER